MKLVLTKSELLDHAVNPIWDLLNNSNYMKLNLESRIDPLYPQHHQPPQNFHLILCINKNNKCRYIFIHLKIVLMSVKVAVRVRPFNSREQKLGCECVVDMQDPSTLLKPYKS